METNERSNGYEYSYSSSKQQEIDVLKEKYASALSQNDILSQMKQLDREVEKSANKMPIVLGTIGMIMLAIGMCLTLTMSSGIFFVTGIIMGVPGILLVGIAYPLYLKNIKKERKKAAPRMLELAENRKDRG